MTEWRAYHVYTSQVDRLIVECVHPFFQKWESQLERRSWERHYAGGPHLRIRLQGPAAVVETAGEELAASARAFLAVHPSPDLADYSEAQVARLLEWEETPAGAGEDLRYRNNVIEEHSYPPATDVYVSREAARMMEDFRHDIMPLVFLLLTGPRPRREALLRLYFLKAIEGSGDIAAGSVSYKSHWEGFASSFSSLTVIERIQASYSSNREYFQTLLREVADLFEQGRIDEDLELAAWQTLLRRYRSRARQILATGTHITPQAATPEEALQWRRRAESLRLRDSEFVRTFWSDESFVSSLQHEPSFLVPRVLTNLLYTLLAAVGLKAIDKFTLCHVAFRAAEDHTQCNLTEILRQNIAGIVARHSGGQTSEGAARDGQDDGLNCWEALPCG
jgi:hypothetical protein